MSVNDRNDGLLKALQTIPKEHRDTILENLPPDQVRSMLSLSIGRNDGNLAPLPQPLVPVPVTQQQVFPAPESAAISKKRGHSPVTTDHSKRAKSDVPIKREAEDAAVPVIVHKEPDVINLISDDDEASEPEANRLPEPEVDGQPANAQAKVKEEREPADLPIYLRVRSEGGQTILKDIDDLPVLVQAELKRRYKEMWSAFKGRREYYATITNNPGHYIRNPEKPWCIRNLVVRGSRGEVPSFSEGGSFRNTADDRCVRALEPCAHLASHDGEYIIRMVPLPSTLRVGKNWRDLGYWVLSESG